MENKYYIDIEDNIRLDYDPSSNKRYSLKLGNLTTAGWYWNSDDAYNLLGFFIRSITSDFRDAFLEEMSKKSNFATFKKDLLKSASKGSGLYEISGDNGTWYFTSNLDDYIDEEIKEIVEFRKLKLNTSLEKFIDKLHDFDYIGVEYEDFEKEYKKRYIEEVSDIISKSKDFYDLDSKLHDYKESKINDYVKEFIDNSIENAIKQAI